MQPVSGRPNEGDIIGPYRHQKLNAWDYIAAVPLLGTVSSLVRVISNLGQVISTNENNKNTNKYKASVNGIKKGSIEFFPLAGTFFVIYVLYKDHKREANNSPRFKTAEEEANYMGYNENDHQQTFDRNIPIPESVSTGSFPSLNNNYFNSRTIEEEAGDSVNSITEIITTHTFDQRFVQLLSQAKTIFEDCASKVKASQVIISDIDSLEFQSKASEINPSNDENVSKIIRFVDGALNKLKENLTHEQSS